MSGEILTKQVFNLVSVGREMSTTTRILSDEFSGHKSAKARDLILRLKAPIYRNILPVCSDKQNFRRIFSTRGGKHIFCWSFTEHLCINILTNKRLKLYLYYFEESLYKKYFWANFLKNNPTIVVIIKKTKEQPDWQSSRLLE